MDELKKLAVDRRGFVAGAGFAILGGCVSCPDRLTDAPEGPVRFFGDVHTHFFNISDLPTQGFIEHVLVPNRASKFIHLAKALGDLGGWAKAMAPTIAEEAGGRYLPLESIPERWVSARTFSQGAARRINRHLAGQAPVGQPAQKDFAEAAESTEESYAGLAALLNSGGDVSAASRKAVAEPVSAKTIEAIITGAAARAAGAAPAGDPCATEEVKCLVGGCHDSSSGLVLGWEEVKLLLKWLWDMAQGRCNHVRQYLRLTRSRGGEVWRPRLVVHHLVDYDEWLEDGPAKASSHEAQIRFWHEFARSNANEISLVTFAGYDPLKHAQQKLKKETPFCVSLQQHYREGRIGGFKLYPPMGFKPAGNKDEDYRLPDDTDLSKPEARRARGIVDGRWKLHFPGEPVGPHIDAALRDFFEFCLSEDAPILSHAIPGNQADCCFGERANPAHWADFFEREPRYGRLRLCLGHIVNSAACFVEAMEARDPAASAPDHVWAVHGTARLLLMSQQGKADVYADIGYLSEVIEDADESFAIDFFSALKSYCQLYDPGCRRILFGTDWIMVGWEVGYERYVERVRRGMEKAGWDPDWQENLLCNNLVRFLGRSAPAAERVLSSPARSCGPRSSAAAAGPGRSRTGGASSCR